MLEVTVADNEIRGQRRPPGPVPVYDIRPWVALRRHHGGVRGVRSVGARPQHRTGRSSPRPGGLGRADRRRPARAGVGGADGLAAARGHNGSRGALRHPRGIRAQKPPVGWHPRARRRSPGCFGRSTPCARPSGSKQRCSTRSATGWPGTLTNRGRTRPVGDPSIVRAARQRAQVEQLARAEGCRRGRTARWFGTWPASALPSPSTSMG